MASLEERVREALTAKGFNCGFKAAQEWCAIHYPGQPLPESSFYKIRRDLHEQKRLPAAAYDKPASKFSNTRQVVSKPGATLPTRAAILGGSEVKKTAPEVKVSEEKPTPEVPATEVISGTTAPETTPASDVTFAELMSVAAVVKQLGAEKTRRALEALNELQTTLLVTK